MYIVQGYYLSDLMPVYSAGILFVGPHACIQYRDIVCRTSCLYIIQGYYLSGGPGSSVGIATDYGLDGPGSNPGGDEIFRPSRPALELSQPLVKWVPALSRG